MTEDVTIPFDPTTCPDPAVTLADMHQKSIDMLNALKGFVCEKDAESIARYDALVAAVTALRDNTSTAINNINTLLATDTEGLAAANTFITQNKTAIDALVAAVATNTAAAAANTAAASANTSAASANTTSAAANTASTATNAALLASVETLTNSVKVAADALAGRVTILETGQADQVARIVALENAGTSVFDPSSIEAKNVAQDVRLDALEQTPQQQVDLTAVEDKNTAQDVRLTALESDTKALDAVCSFAKALKAAVAALPSTPTDFACTNATPAVIPTMALNAATPAGDADSTPGGGGFG